MARRSFWRFCVALAALLALATPAFAGGWAVVTLDSLPSDIQAGQPLSLGFMVLQHGVRPIDTNPSENTALAPLLVAKHTVTGETIEASARRDGPIGHFVVDVTFPSAGSWEIEIIPPPFAGTKLGTFTVAAATAKSESQPLTAAFFADRSPRVWSIMALVLVVALALTMLVQREWLAWLLAGRTAGRTRPADEPPPTHSRVS